MRASTSLDTITYKSFSVTGPPWSLYVTDTRADFIDRHKLLIGWSPSWQQQQQQLDVMKWRICMAYYPRIKDLNIIHVSRILGAQFFVTMTLLCQWNEPNLQECALYCLLESCCPSIFGFENRKIMPNYEWGRSVQAAPCKWKPLRNVWSQMQVAKIYCFEIWDPSSKKLHCQWFHSSF